MIETIKAHHILSGCSLSMIEIGGRDDSFYNKLKNKVGISCYVVLDVDTSKCEKARAVEGDICCPMIDRYLDYFDIVISRNVFEHLKEPWKAAENCVKLSKPGGLNIHQTCFAWRYHPVPSDYFRFTHQGLSSLFERTGIMKELVCGYDIERRRVSKSGKLLNGSDKPPRDELGRWLENWLVLYVGRKNKIKEV